MDAYPETPLGGLRILVADDNETLRLAVSAMLRILGHRIDSVRDGREAVDAAARGDYDVVLLDLQMPVMDGIEAAGVMSRRRTPGASPRLIGMSGNAREQEWARAAGMDHFLAKPVRVRDLARVLGGSPSGPPR